MKKKNTFIKKITAIILAVLTLISTFAFSTTAQAASLTVNKNYPTKNITGYILSTNNKTAIAYSSSSCTSSSRIGYIYSTDDAVIKKIYTNGVIIANVPWSGYKNGRDVYSKLSYFFQNTSSVYTKKATVKTPCYNRSNLSKSLGYVYVGDTCYVVGESGNYYQVLCPWTGNVYRICWVNKSAFNSHSHNYNISGYEAAHPHKLYKKCSCGAYYYTGQTTKYSNCSTCYPAPKSTLSMSGNVPILKGVRLYEYPIGSKVPSGMYFNVNGKSTYVAAKQCYGYACYVEHKLYGCCWHTKSSAFKDVANNVRPNNNQLKDIVTKAGAGAHLRTNSGHSMVIASVTSSGFTVLEANKNWDLAVSSRTFTWSSFNSNYPGGIYFVEVHK